MTLPKDPLSINDLHTDKDSNDASSGTGRPTNDVKATEPKLFEYSADLGPKQVDAAAAGRPAVQKNADLASHSTNQHPKPGRGHDAPTTPYLDDIQLLREQLTTMADEAEIAANNLNNNVTPTLCIRAYVLLLCMHYLPA